MFREVITPVVIREMCSEVLLFAEEVPRMTGNIFSLLKIPGCIVIYLVILGCGMSLSFLDPTFSPWMLKQVCLFGCLFLSYYTVLYNNLLLLVCFS